MIFLSFVDDLVGLEENFDERIVNKIDYSDMIQRILDVGLIFKIVVLDLW